jgi:hypothetical protein
VAKGFVEEHPWMTFFLGFVAIGGVVSIVQSISSAAAGKTLAGAPRLPPKPAGT